MSPFGSALRRLVFIGLPGAAVMTAALVQVARVDRAGAVAPVGARGLAHLQLVAYAELTGAAHRYPDLTGAAQELALVACAVALTALVAVAVRLRVHPVALAPMLVLLAACPPAVGVLVTFGSGLLGTAWLSAGAALLTSPRSLARALGVAVMVLGLLTAPLLAVPVAVLVVGITARRWAPTAAVASALGCAALVLVHLSATPETSVTSATTGTGRDLLVATAAVVVVVGLVFRGLRAVAAATASTALLLVGAPWTSFALLPALVVATVALGAAELDEFVWHLRQRQRWLRRVAVAQLPGRST
ncbi:hypothetical protein [Pseudonocardia charpentierae]|uniref:Uncharacterized protein n=1 Tax=Pseudonocardia charpentierae TaxID=3075545 RepID=A0ABU2NBB0_9PSEU|nr:hypothetical protein [Pseudonocardia sp. DSM 45834]MDT0351242.1 hypothetical protein [Pseudonocardia sp. DSM 45834]